MPIVERLCFYVMFLDDIDARHQ